MFHTSQPSDFPNQTTGTAGKTEVFQVAPDGQILTHSAGAVPMIAAFSDVVQIDAFGRLTLQTNHHFLQALAQATTAQPTAPSQIQLYSDQSSCSVSFHVTPGHPGQSLVVIHAHIPNPSIPLTRRERDVLDLFSKGMRRDRIAHTLQLSIATVDFHTAKLRKKLDAKTTAEAVAKALAKQPSLGAAFPS